MRQSRAFYLTNRETGLETMAMSDVIMMVLIVLSISANIYLTYQLKATKSLIKDRQPSIELDEFVADLLDGNGIVKITRINPHDIFLRSPRARR